MEDSFTARISRNIKTFILNFLKKFDGWGWIPLSQDVYKFKHEV